MPTPGELKGWAARFLEKIKAIPGVTDVTTDQLNAGPMLDITIKRDVASTFGILPYTIDNTLSDAFDQRIVSTMFTSQNQYPVIREVDPKFQDGPEALSGVYVRSSSGQQVPLSTLVDSAVKVAPLVINHQGQFPSVTISFNLAPGTAIGQATSAIQQVQRELGAPLSLQTSFQGKPQAFGASLATTPILIAAALFVIYLILGMLYESLIHPITIISTLPSAGLGALLLLMAVNYNLSVIAIVGIILLIGIVKKNGIVLVDFALHVELGGLLDRLILIAWDQMNHHRQAVDVRYKDLALRIEGAATPVHAAEVAGKGDGSAHARRCENALGAEFLHQGATGLTIFRRQAPRILGAQTLRHDGRRRERKGLRRRGLFTLSITLGNRTLLHAKDRRPSCRSNTNRFPVLLPATTTGVSLPSRRDVARTGWDAVSQSHRS
jgi:hypothetical protein